MSSAHINQQRNPHAKATPPVPSRSPGVAFGVRSRYAWSRLTKLLVPAPVLRNPLPRGASTNVTCICNLFLKGDSCFLSLQAACWLLLDFPSKGKGKRGMNKISS